jgi:general secretion pathway protein N
LTAHRHPGVVRPWRWALAGACIGAMLTLLVQAPALWLSSVVQQLSQSRVQLPEARGTVWQGSAQLMLTGGPDSRDRLTLPGRMHWQWHLDSGGLGLSLQADCCMHTPTRLWLQLAPEGLSLRVPGHRSDWPAALLSGLGAPWNTLQPQGKIALASEGLQLRLSGWRLSDAAWLLQGAVSLTAHDVSSRLSPLRPMGTYQVTVQGHGMQSPPSLQLQTLDGALQLQGQGQWVAGRLRFAGEARALPGQEAALSNLLNIIGRREGSRSLLSLG